MAKDANGDFWTDVIEETKTGPEDLGDDFDPSQVCFGGGSTHSVIDEVLGGGHLASPQFSSVRALANKTFDGHLVVPVNAGTRVAFKANLGSVLAYADVPHPACEGTVVTVKTANGPATHQGNDVFVLWDDTKFRVIRAEHLKLGTQRKTANNFRMVVSDLGDISALFVTAKVGDDLVHKATKDLWSVKKDGEAYVIARLFDDTGKPLKV